MSTKSTNKPKPAKTLNYKKYIYIFLFLSYLFFLYELIFNYTLEYYYKTGLVLIPILGFSILITNYRKYVKYIFLMLYLFSLYVFVFEIEIEFSFKIIIVPLTSLAIFLLIPYFKALKNKHLQFISFLITLFCSFGGVFLAVTINTKEKEDYEKTLVKTMIEKSKLDVQISNGSLYNFILQEESIHPIILSDSNYFQLVSMGFHIPVPTLAFMLSQNSMVQNHISYFTIRTLLSCKMRLSTLEYYLTNIPCNNGTFLLNAFSYRQILKFIERQLGQELKWQNKEINDEQLKDSTNLYDSLYTLLPNKERVIDEFHLMTKKP